MCDQLFRFRWLTRYHANRLRQIEFSFLFRDLLFLFNAIFFPRDLRKSCLICFIFLTFTQPYEL